MARKDALLRIHKHLLARREALRKALSGEMEGLQLPRVCAGDSADAASDAANHAVSSELAELESRELAQIERALDKIRQGTYGICEGCEKRIPVARLNALPYTAFCLQCQRDHERWNQLDAGTLPANWDHVRDADGIDADEFLRLSDIELDLSRS